MKNKNILSSFKYAIIGIYSAFKSERNLIIDIFAIILVIIFGIRLKIEYYEWLICIVLFSLVISAELFNTAIETVVDLASPEINQLAKKAKDISAGAVMINAITSGIIGAIIFIPKIIELLK